MTLTVWQASLSRHIVVYICFNGNVFSIRTCNCGLHGESHWRMDSLKLFSFGVFRCNYMNDKARCTYTETIVAKCATHVYHPIHYVKPGANLFSNTTLTRCNTLLFLKLIHPSGLFFRGYHTFHDRCQRTKYVSISGIHLYWWILNTL